MSLNAILVIIGAVAFEVLGQMAFKKGALKAGDESHGVWRYWLEALRNRWVQAGIAAHVAVLLLWVAALSLAPLSLAFPMMSLSYCGVAVAGRVFLGERLAPRGMLAIAMITAGAGLISLPS